MTRFHRTIGLLIVLFASCTPDRRGPQTPDDFGFIPTPADFDGVALCADGADCLCCCFKVVCSLLDIGFCENPDELETDPAYAADCAACRAGNVDAGARCSNPPK